MFPWTILVCTPNLDFSLFMGILLDVVNDDVDKECQKLAIQSMMLMEHTVKQVSIECQDV